MSKNTNSNNYQHRRGVWLWWHTLTPSATSLTGCIILGLVIVGLHILLLSMNPDLVVPKLYGEVNDQLIASYNGSFLEPIDRALNNSTLSTLTTALVWGTVGWVIYAVLDFIVTTVREVHSSESQIRVPGKNQVVTHPLKRSLLIRLLWRFFVGMLVITYTVLAVPYFGRLFNEDVLLMQSSNILEALRHLATALLGWALIFQIYVILFRLFVQRTRVTGEILY